MTIMNDCRKLIESVAVDAGELLRERLDKFTPFSTKVISIW